MKNPYEILGVSKTATQEEIKKAYRNLVKKNHPDLNPGNKKAEERFKEISHAYELIGSAEDRAKFDSGETDEQIHEQWQQRASQTGGHGGPRAGRYSQSFADQFGADFFEELFGSHRKKSKQAPREDLDSHYKMSISFRESILGEEKVITLANGKNLKVKIPPGITSGTKLRFKNLGEELPGLPPGDAYVEIKVEPLPGWERMGLDLETEVEISFIEAILGAEISVPTLYGPVMLKIPAGVNSGSKLRIKGKGVKLGPETGNQIVKLKVMLPKTISPELRATVANWKGAFDYNPRSTINPGYTEQAKAHTHETRGEV